MPCLKKVKNVNNNNNYDNNNNIIIIGIRITGLLGTCGSSPEPSLCPFLRPSAAASAASSLQASQGPAFAQTCTGNVSKPMPCKQRRCCLWRWMCTSAAPVTQRQSYSDSSPSGDIRAKGPRLHSLKADADGQSSQTAHRRADYFSKQLNLCVSVVN